MSKKKRNRGPKHWLGHRPGKKWIDYADWEKAKLGKPDYKPVLERQLKARNEFFVALATWKRVDGLWMCVEAAPSLGWMKRMDPASAKLELAKRGCSWEWV